MREKNLKEKENTAKILMRVRSTVPKQTNQLKATYGELPPLDYMHLPHPSTLGSPTNLTSKLQAAAQNTYLTKRRRGGRKSPQNKSSEHRRAMQPNATQTPQPKQPDEI